MHSPFKSESCSLYPLVTRAVLFRKAFSAVISEAFICFVVFFFPCLSYRASFVVSLCSKPATAEGLAESSASFFCLSHKLTPFAGT